MVERFHEICIVNGVLATVTDEGGHIWDDVHLAVLHVKIGHFFWSHMTNMTYFTSFHQFVFPFVLVQQK